MNNVTARNLYDFGDYMKKQLTISLLVIFSALITLFLGIIELIILVGFVIMIAGIAVLVFEIMMLIRLYRAKESSPQNELIKCFQFFFGVIIISVILSLMTFFNVGGIFALILDFIQVVLNLMVWKSMGAYVALYGSEEASSSGFENVSKGVKMFTISVYVSITTDVVSFFVVFIGSIALILILTLVSLGISIFSIVASFKIANGMKEVFGGVRNMTQFSTQTTIPQKSSEFPKNNTGKRYCSQCGTELKLDARFCGVCGFTL